MPPDFLAIGHVARDVSPDGFVVGGAAAYAALTALRMGLYAAVVTSAGPDLDPRSTMPGVQVHVVPSQHTTTFHNIYAEGRRTQLVEGVAGAISSSDVPPEWLSAPLVLLGPLVGEVSYDLAPAFPNAVVLASIQGWLRRWDDDGRVQAARWKGTEVLPHVDAAVFSGEDVEDQRGIDRWAAMVPVLILTKGREGASVHYGGCWRRVAPFPAREVDPTGAGDVFAAAYLVRFQETRDPLESARFGSCAASFCVEAKGTDGIPTRSQVERRLSAHNLDSGMRSDLGR